MTMKTSLIFIILSFSLILASCGSAEEFSQLENLDGVEVMHLPSGLVSLSKTFVSKSVDKESERIINGVKNLDLVSCYNSQNREKVMKNALDAVSKSKSEVLMNISEGAEHITIYGRCDFKNLKVTDVVIVAENPDELSVIRAKGNFNISNLLNAKQQKVKLFTNNGLLSTTSNR